MKKNQDELWEELADIVNYGNEKDFVLSDKIAELKIKFTIHKNKLDGLFDQNKQFESFGGDGISPLISNVSNLPGFVAPPIPETTKLLCNTCGGELALIRGRYPKQDKRYVCPTCATERLEQINEISDKNYGLAMKNGFNIKK